MDRAGLLCDGCSGNPMKLLVMLTHPSGVTRTNVAFLGAAVMDITGGLEVLTRPEDLIQAVREEIKRVPGVLGPHQAWSWSFSPLLKGAYFSNYTIAVPLDSRTEQIAHRVLAQCNAEPPTGDFTETPCREAIEALLSFKNPENIQLLEEYLGDSYNVETNKDKFYPLRFAATSVLKSWGIPPKAAGTLSPPSDSSNNPRMP